MATFETAYKKYVQPWEGGYANNPADKGGETYAGIARNYHPTWSGWAYIDEKKKTGTIKNNQKFPAIQDKVDKFYLLAFWEPNKLGEINNQAVAEITLDWLVNSGSNAVRTKGGNTFGIDEILNRDFGFNLPMDSKLDQASINAINKVDSVRLYNAIKKERINFYNELVKNDPTQAVFKKGWMNRINSFPDIAVSGVAGLLVLFIVVVFVFFVNK